MERLTRQSNDSRCGATHLESVVAPTAPTYLVSEQISIPTSRASRIRGQLVPAVSPELLHVIFSIFWQHAYGKLRTYIRSPHKLHKSYSQNRPVHSSLKGEPRSIPTRTRGLEAPWGSLEVEKASLLAHLVPGSVSPAPILVGFSMSCHSRSSQISPKRSVPLSVPHLFFFFL